MIDASPADVLRELIHGTRLSQHEFARAVQIAQSTISALLNGNRQLTTGQIAKLATYFHVSPVVFLPR